VEIYTVNILKDITNLVSQNKHDELLKLSYMLIAILVAFYIFTWFTRRFEAYLFGEPRNIIYKRVIEKFIRLDNNITETTGTGKFISILQNGIITWADMFQYIFRN
jgi:ABC-type multidrug transport system fused ATPase/permease subunit